MTPRIIKGAKVIKKVFEKHETLFCILLIVLYVVSNSLCMQNFGVADPRSAVVNTVLSVALAVLVIALKRGKYYGFAKVQEPRKFLWFVPLLLIISVNFWSGINLNHTPQEIIFHILTMLGVGFIEELDFRGFLFRMMAKDNLKIAILVNSLTFGIGHIINLFNGADLVPTLLQVGYATAVGYLFVTITYRSGSIIPCIIAHSLNNSFSIFNAENDISTYVVPVFLMIVPTIYAIYINKQYKTDTNIQMV